MSTYIISYDLLKASEKDYAQLFEAIKSYETWAHLNESTWIIVTSKSALEVREHLKDFMDADDRIMVVKSGVEAAWRNAMCKDEWLKKNL